jgi:hypothetical protein
VTTFVAHCFFLPFSGDHESETAMTGRRSVNGTEEKGTTSTGTEITDAAQEATRLHTIAMTESGTATGTDGTGSEDEGAMTTITTMTGGGRAGSGAAAPAEAAADPVGDRAAAPGPRRKSLLCRK